MADRVLLTGASGLLGTWLRRAAPAGLEVVSVVHRTPLAGASGAPGAPTVVERADLRDAGAVRALLQRVRPRVVLHAAMALDAASIVGATEHVVAAAAGVGAGVVHVSTDAVFSGDGRRVAEADEPDPCWDYGRWKAAAEASVRAGAPGAAVVRLPLVVSLDPADRAVERVRAGAADGGATTWFGDELRQPALAEDLVAALWQIAALDPEERGGAWHLMGPERLSRFDIAGRIAEVLGLPPSSVRSESTPEGSDRPRDLHLGADRARDAIGWDPRPVLR
jgi:dTDP-4-dehydrorhamnose reductase